MNYNVRAIDIFERQAKRLINKYPSLKAELLLLINELKQNSQRGTPIGNGCYKIRVGIASKGKGKSGGGRGITNIAVSEMNIYLLSIYDKSEKQNLTDTELKELLANIP